MKITSGPNWQFYVVTTMAIILSIVNRSWWPIGCWLMFCIVFIPLGLMLAVFQARSHAKHCKYMLEHFGNDPEVQKKYGNHCK